MIKQELKVGNSYIITNKYGDRSYKIKILELTETSIYVLYEDESKKFRETASDFYNRFVIVEDLGNPLDKTLIDFLKQDYTFYPEYVHVQCRNKICFCDGSCYKPKTFK